MLSRGELAIFRCFSLALQYWQIAWVTPSTFRKVSGIETFYAWERKITSFSRSFCPTVRKDFPGTTSKLQNFWDLEIFYAYNGFPSIFFCLTVPKNFLRNHLKFQNVSNVRCRKVFCKRTEYHDYPSKIFFLGAEKFLWGTLRYIRKVRLSKNFMTKRLITLFSVEFFPRTPPLNFVGEPLCVSESLGHRKLFCSVGAAHFSVGFSGLPILKNLVGNPFSLTQDFGYRNFLCMRTENQVFLPNILFLTIPKKFVVTTSKFQILWDLEKFWSYLDFPSIFLVSQYRKTSSGTT